MAERDYQKSMRALFQECADFETVTALVKSTVEAAVGGDADARRLVWPYIFGAAPKGEVEGGNDNRVINVFQVPAWWAAGVIEGSAEEK